MVNSGLCAPPASLEAPPCHWAGALDPDPLLERLSLEAMAVDGCHCIDDGLLRDWALLVGLRLFPDGLLLLLVVIICGEYTSPAYKLIE